MAGGQPLPPVWQRENPQPEHVHKGEPPPHLGDKPEDRGGWVWLARWLGRCMCCETADSHSQQLPSSQVPARLPACPSTPAGGPEAFPGHGAPMFPQQGAHGEQFEDEFPNPNEPE